MIRPVVHLVDDDDAVRASLGFVLECAGLEARTYASADELLASACDLSGCIVTDVRMAGVDGLQLLQQLRALGVRVPVVVMTGHADVGLAVRAMKAGVVDFLEKPFHDDVFLAAVSTALDGGARAAEADIERCRVRAALASLSGRETQVFSGLVRGQSNKEIARDLAISPRTVEAYRAHVMRKTRAETLSTLVRMAVLAGYGEG